MQQRKRLSFSDVPRFSDRVSNCHPQTPREYIRGVDERTASIAKDLNEGLHFSDPSISERVEEARVFLEGIFTPEESLLLKNMERSEIYHTNIKIGNKKDEALTDSEVAVNKYALLQTGNEYLSRTFGMWKNIWKHNRYGYDPENKGKSPFRDTKGRNVTIVKIDDESYVSRSGRTYLSKSFQDFLASEKNTHEKLKPKIFDEQDKLDPRENMDGQTTAEFADDSMAEGTCVGVGTGVLLPYGCEIIVDDYLLKANDARMSIRRDEKNQDIFDMLGAGGSGFLQVDWEDKNLKSRPCDEYDKPLGDGKWAEHDSSSKEGEMLSERLYADDNRMKFIDMDGDTSLMDTRLKYVLKTPVAQATVGYTVDAAHFGAKTEEHGALYLTAFYVDRSITVQASSKEPKDKKMFSFLANNFETLNVPSMSFKRSEEVDGISIYSITRNKKNKNVPFEEIPANEKQIIKDALKTIETKQARWNYGWSRAEVSRKCQEARFELVSTAPEDATFDREAPRGAPQSQRFVR